MIAHDKISFECLCLFIRIFFSNKPEDKTNKIYWKSKTVREKKVPSTESSASAGIKLPTCAGESY